MSILVFGAGPLGSLYAHRLIQAGEDVTVLARDERYERIQAHGLTLVDEMAGAKEHSSAPVVDELNALYKHDGDNYALAKDKATMRAMVRAAKEGGRVLRDLGYTQRQPFQCNLPYWLPEMLNVTAIEGLLESKLAEVAFARHAGAARGEFGKMADDFQRLVNTTSVATPNIELLRGYAG